MTELTDSEKLTVQTYDSEPAVWSDYFDNTGGWPKELEKFHRLLQKGRILEIGAGTGRDAQDLIGLGYDFVGTDISEKLLEIARRNVPHAKFLKMSLYDLDFPEKFDGFWASAVLLHVPKNRMDEALKSIGSTQKRGAIGFISIKDGKGERVTVKKFGDNELERFFSFWSKNEFEAVLRRNNYSVLDYDYRIVSANTHWHMFIVKLA